MEIKTQDCYLPVDAGSQAKVFYLVNPNDHKTTLVEKHTDMVVLTREQYDQNIEDAKDEERQRINDLKM